MIRSLRLVATAITAAALSLACSSVDNSIDVGPDGVSSGGVSVSAIEPANGPQHGGQVVTITGTGFSAGDTTVVIGDAVAETFVVDGTTLRAVTSASTVAGAAEVVVFTNGGYGSRTGIYTLDAGPTVSAVSEIFGNANGGSTVTLTGTGFSVGMTEVVIGGVPAMVSVTSDTSLDATVGAYGGNYSVVDIVVNTAGGSATLSDSFAYAKPGILAAQGNRVDNRSVLLHIDVATGEATNVGQVDIDTSFSSMTRTPDGTIYAAGRDMVLYRLNPLDLSTERVGDLGPSPNQFGQPRMKSLISAGGVVYGVFRAPGDEIVSINVTTAEVTPIGVPAGGVNRLGRDGTTSYVLGGTRITPVNPLTATETGAPVVFDDTGNIRSLHSIGGSTYALAANGQNPFRLLNLNITTATYTELAVMETRIYGGVDLDL